MNSPSTDKLRSILARGGSEKAADLLQRLDPAVAADAMLDIPFEDQRAIFRSIRPIRRQTGGRAPYYLAYVLLHSRPQAELVAIVDQMDSDDRMRFIEELPEEAWNAPDGRIGGQGARRSGGPRRGVPAPARGRRTDHRGARHREIFERPDGAPIQVIAPTDLTWNRA